LAVLVVAVAGALVENWNVISDVGTFTPAAV
jgi:hypothetical protein